MDTDIQNIEQLLSEKKYDQVRMIVASVAVRKFSDEEMGAALTGLASTYLDISNAISMRYRNALQEAIVGMKAINAAEMKASEKITSTT